MRKTEKVEKLNYKLIITIIVVIAIIALVVVLVNKNKKKEEPTPIETFETMDNGEKYNTSEKLQETKTFEGYEISNISLKEIDGENYFNAKIKNVADQAIGNKSIYIVFKAQTGEDIYKMQVYVGKIEPGKSTNVTSKITKDIIGSYDVEIQF